MIKISPLYRRKARKHLLESADLKKKIARECLKSILDAVRLIVDTFEGGGKVLICGNGGSAADSQHMAAELVCILIKSFQRPPFAAIALTTDTSILTAQANDMGFENIFKRQIIALGRPRDLLIAISTSGNSPNILTAVKAARTANIHTVALTGRSGKLQHVTDIAICVPSTVTAYIQESHIAIEHIVCELVEHHFYGHK